MTESPPDPHTPGQSPTDGAASTAARPVSRAVVLAIVAPFLAWLAFMAVIALVAGTGLDAVAAGGWRLTAYRDVAAGVFVLALLAALAGVIVLEIRRRR